MSGNERAGELNRMDGRELDGWMGLLCLNASTPGINKFRRPLIIPGEFLKTVGIVFE